MNFTITSYEYEADELDFRAGCANSIEPMLKGREVEKMLAGFSNALALFSPEAEASVSPFSQAARGRRDDGRAVVEHTAVTITNAAN